MVAKERKRRELEPTLEILKDCEAELKGSSGKEAQAFQKQIKSLSEFVEMGNNAMEKISKAEKNVLLKWLLKLL